MCAGRHGLQPAAAVILPVGPSSGIVYGPRDHGEELVAAVGVGADLAAQVALRRAGHEARVAALGVGLPDVEVGVGQRRAVGVGHAARDAACGRRARRGGAGSSNGASSSGRVGQVERAEDRARRAVAVAERLLLDDVLDVDVAEQRPLARLADVDEPLLGGLVLLVGDVVLDDRLVDAPQDVGDQDGWRDQTSLSPRFDGVGVARQRRDADVEVGEQRQAGRAARAARRRSRRRGR